MIDAFIIQLTFKNEAGSKFGAVTYSIIGDDGSGQRFNIDSSSGEITLRADLQTENTYLYRVWFNFTTKA